MYEAAGIKLREVILRRFSVMSFGVDTKCVSALDCGHELYFSFT